MGGVFIKSNCPKTGTPKGRGNNQKPVEFFVKNLFPQHKFKPRLRFKTSAPCLQQNLFISGVLNSNCEKYLRQQLFKTSFYYLT
jgi:hypothetical protein